jgi:hypothetical protein
VREFGVAQGVTGDSADNVYVLERGPIAGVLVFDRSGALLRRWTSPRLQSPHGIWMTPGDELLITDREAHTVTKWTTTGHLLWTLGTDGVAGTWGSPFNGPTKAVETPDGDIYVSDGYGNRHVHRFSRDGTLRDTWGGVGAAPGEFGLPHDVALGSDARLLVCDRANDRVQQFDRDGTYLAEWSQWQRPMQIFIRHGRMYVAHAWAAISVRTLDGALLASWSYESTVTHDQEKSPHSTWVDSVGDIYVAEVVGPNGFQKFMRV